MSLLNRRFILCATVLLGLSGSGLSLAQDAWPNKPVRMVVPFAAGGSTDVIARLVGQKLSELWGQPVVIENRTGAGGNVGADVVAKSAADGYTLLMASGSVTINPALYKKMPFDTKKDLAPITNVVQGPMLVVVKDDSPYKTLKDLITAAKNTPGAINFASAGVGSQVHLAAENFADAAGVELQHVPYRGEALGYTDLAAGQVQMMVGNFAAASALVGPGRLRPLTVTSKTRMSQMPNVPTAHEAGLTGFENVGWFGLFAPAGIPPGVLQKVERDVAKVMEGTEIKARLYVQGMSPAVKGSADFTQQIDQELERWAKLIATRKIQAN